MKPVSVTLVLGGARSGKSRYAEELAEAGQGACIYLATAEAGDAEMRLRIAEHQTRRGSRWRTVEEPMDLPGALLGEAGPGRTVLVDCLTLWLANLMEAGFDIEAEGSRLVRALESPTGPVVLVASEVGLGIVPENALARAFRDHAGRLNQRVAAVADTVVLMAAGLPLRLKPSQHEGS